MVVDVLKLEISWAPLISLFLKFWGLRRDLRKGDKCRAVLRWDEQDAKHCVLPLVQAVLSGHESNTTPRHAGK
jgi:hypothetical protein